MKTIILNGQEYQVHKPNLASALDFVAMWSTNPSRAHIGRLCAASIGLVCPALHMPGYSMVDAMPIAYGGKCLQRLLEKGITASEVYTVGADILVWLAGLLPQQPEIETTKKNTEPRELDNLSA